MYSYEQPTSVFVHPTEEGVDRPNGWGMAGSLATSGGLCPEPSPSPYSYVLLQFPPVVPWWEMGLSIHLWDCDLCSGSNLPSRPELYPFLWEYKLFRSLHGTGGLLVLAQDNSSGPQL